MRQPISYVKTAIRLLTRYPARLSLHLLTISQMHPDRPWVLNVNNGDVVRNIILSIGILALSGCSTTSSSGMNEIMSSWVDATIDDVVAQWGYPHEQRVADERTFYVWHHNKSGSTPTTARSGINAYGELKTVHTSSNIHETYGTCDRILEADENETVIKWEWRGNKCPFIEAMEYSQWRNKARPN